MPNQFNSIRKITSLSVFLFLSFSIYAQKRVSGKVMANDTTPIPGASIQIAGTQLGTVATSDGSFALTVPAGRNTLVVSFVGYREKEVTIGDQTNLSISLDEDISGLSEAIVTGYSSQQRKNIVGAVSTVSGEKLATVQSGNVEQQFQGRVPGVTVITSGQPGTTSQVRIRGFGSFSNNEPLYIVDGIPVFNVDHLNSNDIESTTVLKDASSASIYGARASAGVIVITTKKGKSTNGKLNVTYDLTYGNSYPGKGIDLLTPQQQADLTWIALRAAGQVDTGTGNPTHPQYGSGPNAVLPDYLKAGDASGLMAGDPLIDMSKYNTNFEKGPIFQIIRANKAGTDWYGALTSVAPIQNHTLGLRGGSDNAKYYAGISYYNEQGTVINTMLKKYTLRLNTEFKVKDFIRIGENFQYTFRERPGIDGPASENDIMFALTINPLIPVYDEGGGFAGTTAKGFNNSTQPVARRIRSRDSKAFQGMAFGNVYAELDFLRNFTARTSFGGYLSQSQFRFMNYRTYENSENVGSNTFGEGAGNSAGYTWTNTVKYSNHDLGKHSVDVLAGIEAIADGYSRFLQGSGLNPFSNSFNYTTLTNTDPSGRALSSEGTPLVKLYSQFGKLDYSFNDRYLASITVRRDGASVFGKTNQYGIFPALSAGWRITEEDFMQNVGFIDELKLRGGYGKMGNSRISPNNLFNSIGGGPGTTGYDITGTNTSVSPGIAITGIGNPFAKWETNETVNIGFDGSFFNHRLDVIFDWYTRKTSDLLFRQELAATLGTATAPFVNIGSMKNTGLDVMLTYKGKVSDLRFEADAIFTTYTNEITKVSDITDNFDVSFSNRIGGGIIRNEVGQAVSAFYGYKVIGLFQSADDVAKSPTQTGAGPGRFKYQDVNTDGVINDQDRTFIGNPNPKFTYGFNARLFYKNFDLEALFYGVQGGKVLNFTRWFTDFYPSFAGIGKSTRVLNAWSETNTNTDIPRFENVSNFSTNAELNSYYVEDASYLRLRSVKIGYNLSDNLASRIGMEKVRFFIQGTNLFTSTKYTGTDPAVSGVDTNFGVDIGNYPVNRQVLVGLNLSL